MTGVTTMQVHDLAKLLHKAYSLALNATRDRREQLDFSRVDWDDWWQANADMPLSGPGFVKLWTDCASDVLAAFAAEEAAAPQEANAVASIVREGLSGTSLAFSDSILHVRKDGSGYIAVDEEHWSLEDDRNEGPDGPEGSVYWIKRFPPGKMQSLKNFLNGVSLVHPTAQAATQWPRGTRIRVEHDGFEGVVLDPYTTLEGKRGHVCQLAGARVVHVYGEKWLQRMDEVQPASAQSEELGQ